MALLPAEAGFSPTGMLAQQYQTEVSICSEVINLDLDMKSFNLFLFWEGAGDRTLALCTC